MDGNSDENIFWRMEDNKLLGVLLRLPPLLVMDLALSNQFVKLAHWRDAFPMFTIFLETQFDLRSRKQMIMNTLIGALILTVSAGTFFMTCVQILNIYSFLSVMIFLVTSYLVNDLFVSDQLSSLQHVDGEWIPKDNYMVIISNLLFQVSVTYFYVLYRQYMPTKTSHLTNFRFWKPLVYLLQLLPVLWRMSGLPLHHMKHIPLTSALIVAIDFGIYFYPQINNIYVALRTCFFSSKHMLNHFGIQTFIENHWNRLNIPDCLRVYWILRTAVFVTQFIRSRYRELESGEMTISDAILLQLVYGCDTLIALSGMTSVVSLIAHYFGLALAAFLRSDLEEDRNMGTMASILFFILALQTGLTGLEQESRLVRLLKNFCLLSTAILHYIHSMVNPQLLNLSAAHRLSLALHWRPLTVCALLLLLPPSLLVFLWSRYAISTWLVAVTAFSVEVVLKVLISLVVYSLFIIDAYRDGFWEQLDDYVYYIQSLGNTIEFVFGILLFCNGGWIMMFESGGTIRAIMMCIHAYFNIWVQAREGWRSFMLRRTAVQKITSLQEADEKELRAHNDVCAICYQELTSARITACNHYFHGVCLRKWLYVRDECPMCHQPIHNTKLAQPPSPPPPPLPPQ